MRIFIKTLGCPKNEVDSELLARQMEAQGHQIVGRPADAEWLVVNTCGFIDRAKDESIGALLDMVAARKPGQQVAAVGCLAERYADRLAAEIPELDLILGVKEMSQLPTQLPRPLSSSSQPPRPQGPSAYLKIADGCSATCAFCVIPQIKGPYRSLPSETILAEARHLAARGVKELVLVAQDTTAYDLDRGEREGLAHLLRALSQEVPQVPWIRLLYAHPAHLGREIIATMAALPQACHYVDIPLQHAHPGVLRRMRRPVDPERYLRLIEDLRQAMPDIALRTSFITGYPGETDAEFEALLEFTKEVAFDRVGVFTYSKEEGTAAAELPGQLSQQVKEERRRRLMGLQEAISQAKNQRLVGQEMTVLVESRPTRGRKASIFAGRSYRDAPEIDGLVICPGKAATGDMVAVRITTALEHDLIGEPVISRPALPATPRGG